MQLEIIHYELGFENVNIEFIYERFTSNPKYLEQLEMNKYDDDIVLNMNAAYISAKITLYARERRDTSRLIKQKISDHNILNEIQWDINLINMNSPNWILIKLLLKINDGIFPELFADGRLGFYN